MPERLAEGYERSGGTCCLYLVPSSTSTLKVQTAFSSETLTPVYQITKFQTPENIYLYKRFN